MAVSQELYDAINNARISFVKMVNSSGEERFWDTPKNRETLITWLKKENIPPSEWVSKHIFGAAFAACDSGSEPDFILEKRPVEAPETEQQKWERIERQNRFDGREGNRINWATTKETPVEAAKRLLKEKTENEQKVLAKIKATAEAQDAKIAAENDLNSIPTPEEIGKNGGLAPAEIKKLSVVQLKRYMANVREWEQKDRINKFNESKARMSQ